MIAFFGFKTIFSIEPWISKIGGNPVIHNQLITNERSFQIIF